jgi:Leucine-rich repeat (LRR) protein
MKNNFAISILLIVFVTSLLHAQKTTIPDNNFENYLETHNKDGAIVSVGDNSSLGDGIENNNLVFDSRIQNVVTLSISNLNIASVIGIAGFTSLSTLICNGNELTDLDVSANINIKSLLCGVNQLTDLDVRSNSNLEVLDCSSNQIENLDLLGNLLLESLTSSGNRLNNLDVGQNSSLKFLSVSNNQLNELIVSNNTNLENLFCASNQITALNLSTNTVLKNLDASNNILTSLDLSSINTATCPNPQTDPVTVCQGIASINVSRNQLTSLIIANGYNDLNSIFNASENPDLNCIQIDTGFTPPVNWLKDDWTYYSETTCTDIYTYIPDDNFEAYLEANGWGDDIANNNFILTSRIDNRVTLNVPSENIDDLTGIEDFIALQNLDCSNNNLTEIDLSTNVNLLDVNCSNNVLPTVNLTSNLLITTLDCSSQTPYVDIQDASNNYVFDALNLKANIALKSVDCSNNAISNLDLSANTLLNNIDCSSNQIQTLNIISNTAFTSLICNNNSLLALNLKNGNNSIITAFNVTNNPSLLCIEVDDVLLSQSYAGWLEDDPNSYSSGCGTYVPDDKFEEYLESNALGDGVANNNFASTTLINAFVGPLNISGLGISDLTGIVDFIVLQELDCSNNNLTNLNLNNNTALTKLNCSTNQIVNLDLTLNSGLTEFLTNDNLLLTLNIENGNNNLLTTFNATNNLNLYCVNIDDAIVGSIPGSWQKDAFTAYNGDCDGARFTAIPDDFFEQTLIDLGYDDVIDDLVLTSNIEHILSIDVSDKSIEALTGIQDFQSLEKLDCSGNYLNALDISGMINLEELNCNSNYLFTNDIADPNGLLNLTGTDSLIKLFCASNNFSSLDMVLNTNLETLDCTNNNLNILNVSGNMQLKILNCSNNNLTDLDISNNIILEEVNCNSNSISTFTTLATNNTTLTSLSCSNNDIPTLLVDSYQVLTNLNCRSNVLTQINTTSNPALRNLDFTGNQITGINLLSNSNLISVLASQNELTQLNFTANTPLETLNCNNNPITQLLVDTTPLIKHLFCTNNQLIDLDLSNNGYLVELNISSNLLSNLILSNNLSTLKTFNCSNNELSGDIDLTTMGTASCPAQFDPDDFCPDSITIDVSNNQLDFLNIQNGINSNISGFNTSNNPELNCIQVDDVNNIGVSWVKDATTKYSLDCRYGETYVPDNAFEQALMDDININVDPILDNYVATSIIEALQTLNINGKGISDLTGIEDFTALQVLNCSNNTLSSMDLSDNVNLIDVNCSNNTFSNLDFSSNLTLTTVDCSNNSLSSLDLTVNVNLTNLNIANNTFSEFEPSTIPTLEVFNCDSNLLVELDFQSNAALTSLSCQSNVLEKLNVRNGQNGNLTNFNAQNNTSLTCIETDDGTIPNGVTWVKDASAEYVINCHYGQTYVPDDAFEQALISLGYDSGALDDYVLTAAIEIRTNLDIKGKGISDLTGIEAFVSLKNLNFESNTVTNVDLSNNLFLENLYASNNTLTNLDLSFAPNLIIVDLSNNNLSQLNLNTNILDLNVESNVLTFLNVDLLVNLEKLNCSENRLVELNVTSNSNLIELFCKSNLFIQDKLNLQNGANQSLEKFNATNNPDLSCVLVDSPLDVITNANGAYDFWFKDDASNYQTVCDDADNDGIANADDVCPNTTFGDPVDLFGCPIFSLPNNNFTVLITGETCLNNNNGKINIATLQYYNYIATLTSDDFNKEYHFTNEIDILNLLAGTYQMCITIEEQPNYLSCYDVIISQPEPLDVSTSKSKKDKQVSIDLAGSSSYNIGFNGLEFNTTNSSITLSLQEGSNSIKVSTDLECQGIYEENIFVSDEVFVYPNPFKEKVSLYLGDIDKENIIINIYSYLGQLVSSKTLVNQKTNKTDIDTSALAVGVYTVSVQTKSSLSTFKIIKK